MKIITLTMNPTIDTSTKIEHVTPDKKLRCERPTHEPGGGGINVSRAIKKLGGNSLSIYPAGGTNGTQLNKLLKDDEIKILPIDIEDTTRENFAIDETTSDKNYRFVMPGPRLKENEWKKIINEIHNRKNETDFLVASGSLPEGVPRAFYAELADCCNRDEIKMIIDTSGDSLKHAVGKGVYLIKPNMRELNDLLGEGIKDETILAEKVQELLKKSGTEYFVLSLGSGGAMLISKDSYTHFRTPTVQIKSKVGAGDSMVGGIVLKLSEGNKIEDAVKYGIAAGASAVSTPGSQLCTKEYTEELYQKISSED